MSVSHLSNFYKFQTGKSKLTIKPGEAFSVKIALPYCEFCGVMLCAGPLGNFEFHEDDRKVREPCRRDKRVPESPLKVFEPPKPGEPIRRILT